MALGESTSYLSDLINLGADAQSNLYYLKLSGGEFTGEEAFSIRNAGISLPARKQNTHEVSYLTTSAELPAASYSDDKKVSITFRLDQNYEIYRKLLKQQKKVYGPSTSFADASPSSADFTIRVYALTNQSSNGITQRLLYTLKHCYLQKVKQDTAFSYSNSSPMTVSVDLWYQEREDWAYEGEDE